MINFILENRLEELSKLEDGDGKEISEKFVTWLQMFFDELYPDDLPLPDLFSAKKFSPQKFAEDEVSLLAKYFVSKKSLTIMEIYEKKPQSNLIYEHNGTNGKLVQCFVEKVR